MEDIKIQNKKTMWCRERNQLTKSNKISILMTKDVVIPLYVLKAKKKHCVPNLRCQHYPDPH